MSEEGLQISWRQLREFSGVDLSQSYILSWHLQGEALMIDIDLCLETEHPFYEAPLPAESACIRPAVIEFRYCTHVGLNGAALMKPSEIMGEIAIGAIHDLRALVDRCYEMRGEFGTVLINAEQPILRLKGP
jgi:hypothetical protein